MTTDVEIHWLILACLAAYRLAYLFAVDNGPYHSFYRLRAWVERRWGEDSWQAEGAACVFCQSVWFSLLAALALIYIDLWPVRLVFAWLGISGAIVILHWLVMRLMRGVV